LPHFTHSFIVGLVEELCVGDCVLGIRVQVQNFCDNSLIACLLVCLLVQVVVHEGFGFVDKVLVIVEV